jgi:hypothetical protein
MNDLDNKIEALLDAVEVSNQLIHEVRELCDDYIRRFGEV